MSDDLEAIVETGGAAAAELAASALAGRGSCRNCNAPVSGAYCANCGQEQDTHRRSVFRLLRDLVEDIVSFDSRIMRTGAALLFEPGELPKAFREGRTHRFMPALRLYFFVSLIFFLILGTTGIALVQFEVVATPAKPLHDAQGNYFLPNPAYDPGDPDTQQFEKSIQVPKELATRPGGFFTYSTRVHFFSHIGAYASKLTPAQRAQLQESVKFDFATVDKKPLKTEDATRAKVVKQGIETGISSGLRRLAADPAALNGPMTTWIPRMLFLLLPLYAVLLAMFYWRQHKKFYFVDHLIFSLSVHTFFFVVLIADVALSQFLSTTLVVWFSIGALGLYILIAMKRFYEQKWFITTLKFCTISFLYTVFFLSPAVAAVVAIGFFGDPFG